MVFDWLSQALGEWKWSMAVLPLILLTLAPSTEAKYDFQVYRANQYDIQKEQYGSRSSVMSYEGRTAGATQIARKTVLIKIEELTALVFQSILEKGPGAMLILIPEEINSPSFPENITQERLSKIYDAEKILMNAMSASTPIPIYFSYENNELNTIYHQIESSSEFLGASAILNAGNQVLHQFSVAGPQPTAIKKKLEAIESKLVGTEQDSKIILITSHLDAVSPAAGLSRGANQGSGTALLLELARMLSIVYEDDSTRPKITVLFAILPADGFNYITTQDWLGQLEDKAEENKILENVDLAICLDGISTKGPLYIHKTPKETEIAKYFISALKENSHNVEVKEVLKKINLQEEKIWWQHERFTKKKIPSLTISSTENPKSSIRYTMLDTYGIVNENALAKNSKVVGDAILSTIFHSTLEGQIITVSEEAVKSWTRTLSSEPRPAGNATSRVLNDIEKHLAQFSSDSKVDKKIVGRELTLYNENFATMSQFLVRPALFDLYLGGIIFSYLGLIYMSIEYFGAFLSMVTPLLSKPALFKKPKTY